MRVSFSIGRGSDDFRGAAPDVRYLAEILNDRPQLAALNSVAIQQLERQFRLFESLNSQSGQLLGVGSAVLPISFVLLNLRDGNPPNTSTWWLIAALVAYLVLLGYYLGTVYVERLQARPELATLRMYVIDRQESAETIIGWVADESNRAILWNHRMLETKQRRVGGLTVALCVEGLCLTIAAITAADLVPTFAW